MRLPMKPAVINESKIETFYAVGTGNADSYYGYYSSIERALTVISYGSTGNLIDDENITIYKSGHSVTFTFKRDGYLAVGQYGESTTLSAKSAGSSVTVNNFYVHALAVAYFV